MRKRSILAAAVCAVLALFCVMPVCAADPVSVQLGIRLVITGDVPSSAESFTFVLEAVGDAPMPENSRTAITGTGSGSFPSITYTKPETYHYIVYQAAGQTEGYVYDDTVYELTVQVITDEAGILKPVLWACERGHTEKTEEIVFTNQYGQSGLKAPGNTPQTGDAQNIGLWSILYFTSLLGLTGIIIFSVRTGRHSGEENL